MMGAGGRCVGSAPQNLLPLGSNGKRAATRRRNHVWADYCREE